MMMIDKLFRLTAFGLKASNLLFIIGENYAAL